MENNTLNYEQTEAKILIEAKSSQDNDDIIYVLTTKKGTFKVVCKEDGGLHISSDAKTMSSAIGGRGEDDGQNAWITDTHCKNQAEAVSNILEILMVISE